MNQLLGEFFNSSYMPHGHCYLWQPYILWVNVVSDLIIAVAYFSIPCLLAVFAKKRPDFRYKGIFILFAVFIWCCGLTHLISIYTIWYGIYGVHGMAKALTAIVSAATAIVLFRSLPQLLAIPSPNQYKQKIEEAYQEKQIRSQLEAERKAESIFKFALELLPTGLLVINENKEIILSNQALASIFGYSPNELAGQPLSLLLPAQMIGHHDYLVEHYLQNPSQRYAMASGRAVRGKARDGHEVTIEISLSSHSVNGESYAFASVIDFDNQSIEKSLQQESNNRIKRAIDATNDGIWEWNLSTQAVWFSQRFLQLIGKELSSGKAQFDDWIEHIIPEDREMIHTAIAKHFEEKNRFDVVYRGRSESGNYEWMHARGDSIFDDHNKPLLMSGVLTNIHHLKTLEHELAEKSEFLNQLLDKSLCAMYIYDIKQERIVFTNPEFTEITGYSPTDIKEVTINKDHMELFHPDCHHQLNKNFAQVLENEDVSGISIQLKFQHRDGRWIWILLRDSTYSFDDRGAPKEILGTFFEITELKTREEKIRTLARDFSTTFEQAAVGIAHVTLEGDLIKANQRLSEILGYNIEALKRHRLEEITVIPDRDIDRQLIEELQQGERDNFAIEKRYVREDGQTVWTNVTVSLARRENLDQSYFIYVVEDISERKRVEQALEESNASLERFAYSASHDLQEPLRKISAFSDSIQQRLKEEFDDPDAIYELSRISNAAQRMREMIDSLLQLSRFTRFKVQKSEVELAELIRLALEDLSELINDSKANIDFDSGACTLWVDHSGIQQVFRNLIVNSIRYQTPGTTPIIKIRFEHEKSMVRLTFEDNGMGFDQANAEQIFEPFQRMVGKDIPGSGMGLALCRQILQAHGGIIKAQGELGKGAIFTIELPKKP